MAQQLRRDSTTVQYRNSAAFTKHATKMQQAGWQIGPHVDQGRKVTVTWYRDVPAHVPPTAFTPPPPRTGLHPLAIVGFVLASLFVLALIGEIASGTRATPTPAITDTGISGRAVINNGTITASTASAGSASSTPSVVRAKVGQRAEIPGMAVTVFEVRDPATSTNQQPKAGFRYVSVDFSIENTGTTEASFNALYASIKDTDSRQYEDSFTTVGSPALTAGKNAAGDKIRGWVTFEVPAAAKLATFKYEPAFSSRQIVFDIGG